VGITGGNVTVDFTQRIAILLQMIWTERFICSAVSTLRHSALSACSRSLLTVHLEIAQSKIASFLLTAELDLSSGEGEISTKEPSRTGAQETQKGGKRLPRK